jgi:hypothetical protein
MNLPKETLDQFARALQSKFHRVTWDLDTEEGSEVNRENWRQCAAAVISELEKTLLHNCTIVAADRLNKTITVELPNNDYITGICLGQSSKILIKKEE